MTTLFRFVHYQVAFRDPYVVIHYSFGFRMLNLLSFLTETVHLVRQQHRSHHTSCRGANGELFSPLRFLYPGLRPVFVVIGHMEHMQVTQAVGDIRLWSTENL